MTGSDDHITEALQYLRGGLEKTPRFPSKAAAYEKLRELEEYVIKQRPPRLMIIGRRGAGKSSLVNAMFKQKVAEVGAVASQTPRGKWYTYEGDMGRLEMLDTRGLGDYSRPDGSTTDDATEEAMLAIDEQCPDAVLFLCKAKDVDARVAEDMTSLKEILDRVHKRRGCRIPVLAIVTQVDELDPRREDPPYESPEKQKNIKDAKAQLSKVFRDQGLEQEKIFAVSAYSEWDENGQLKDSTLHWNVDELVRYLVETLPESARLQMARLARVQTVQTSVARKLTAATATVCAGIAATPIPIGDILPITAAQISLITSIGYLSGRELSTKAAREFMVAAGLNVGGAFVLREAARGLIKWVFPGRGLAVSAGIAFAATWGIGEAATAYFISGAPIEEAKKIADQVKEQKKKDYDQQG
ncbi:MAG: GTPase family protein [Phycisphaerae bacterium]